MNSIAVCSGKGSPGATFTALNLAHAVRSLGEEVLLLDLDPNGGDIAGYLGLDPRRGLYPLSLMGHLDYSTEKLMGEVEERAGISCISGFPSYVTSTSEVLIQIFESARRNDRLVIADIGRLDPRSAEVAASADRIVLVSRPDLISTHATQRAKDHLRTAGADESQILLVVNGLTLRHAADSIEVGDAVGIQPIGMIPLVQRAARQALQTQLPILKGKAAKAFAAIARNLVKQKPTEVVKDAAVA